MNDIFHTTVSIDILIRFTPIILGLYFAFKQFRIKSISKAARIFITLFYLAWAFFQVQTILYYLNFSNGAIYYMLIYVPVILSIPPLFYLYIKTLSQQNLFQKRIKSYVHFIPSIVSFFLISISFILFKFADLSDNSLQNIYNFFSFTIRSCILVFFPLQNIYYIIIILLIYKKHKKSIQEYFSYQSGVSLSWVILFIIGYIIFIFVTSFTEIFYISLYDLTIEFLLIIFLTYSSYHTLKQKEVYSYIDNNTYKTINNIEETLPSSKSEESKGIKDITKNANKHVSLHQNIVKLIEDKQLYLNPKLSIMDISKALDVNGKYISQAINNNQNISFIKFINKYRVEYAKALLQGPKSIQYTIEALSKQAGFNSKSAFNTAFKQEVGETPSVFRKKSSLNI